MSIINTTVENFKTDVLDAKVPVVVDFGTDYCGPCIAIIPFLKTLEQRFEGKVRIVKMNVTELSDAQKELMVRYNVAGRLPTVMFKDGVLVSETNIKTPFGIINMIRKQLEL